MNRSVLLILAASLTGALHAQSTGITALITEAKGQYTQMKGNFLKAADKMPEDAYTFKATPELQTWAERMMHIANQVRTCSGITGEAKQPVQAKSKAEIVAALKTSFDACDAAWDSMNEKTALEMIAGRGGQRTKLGTLVGNTNHDNEMYGYISVYMRLKGIVPPSSDRSN